MYVLIIYIYIYTHWLSWHVPSKRVYVFRSWESKKRTLYFAKKAIPMAYFFNPPMTYWCVKHVGLLDGLLDRSFHHSLRLAPVR